MFVRVFLLDDLVRVARALVWVSRHWKAERDAGRTLALQVVVWQARRTLAQNRRYWGVVLAQIAEKAWIDGRRFGVLTWHEEFKQQFIGCIDLPGGGVIGMSSTDLSVEEFGQFMERVEQYAVETLGITFDDDVPKEAVYG